MPNFAVLYYNAASENYEFVVGPNANETFTAVDGPDANAAACLQNDKDGKYVALSTQGPWKASYGTTFEVSNSNLIFTADTAGTAGNTIRIRYVVAGNNTSLSIAVAGSDITVNVATNGSGVPTSTAALIKAALIASAPANALIDVTDEPGSSGAGIIPEAFSYVNLQHGSDGSAIATIVEQVESTTSSPTTY